MKRLELVFILSFICITLSAQIKLFKPNYLRYDIPQKYETILFIAVDSILADIETGDFDDNILAEDTRELLKSFYDWNLTYYIQLDLKNKVNLTKQITNIYLLEKDVYSISVAYLENKNDTIQLRYNLQLIANFNDNQLVFDLPLHYETKLWRKKTIGNISYIFRGELNEERAQFFDKKNTKIAQKFGLNAAQLDFYMASNFQEILRLFGVNYSIYANGNANEGYGVVDNSIFAVQNNEDFSHDIFHFYSGKISERKDRNWIAEEGIAYLWGNAYYADEHGEMITMDTLVALLKDYLKQKYSKSIYELFETGNGNGLYREFDARVSIRSTISAIIANEVEKTHGQQGIQQLINCGDDKRMANYMKAIDELLGITPENFNGKLNTLLSQF